MRGHAKIEYDTINQWRLLGFQYRFQIPEIAVDDIHPTAHIAKAYPGRSDCFLILVDADDPAGWFQQFGDTAGMTCPAQGAVHIGSFFICHETLYSLFQHHADMMKLHASCSCLSKIRVMVGPGGSDSQLGKRSGNRGNIRINLSIILIPLILTPNLDAVIHTSQHNILLERNVGMISQIGRHEEPPLLITLECTGSGKEEPHDGTSLRLSQWQ